MYNNFDVKGEVDNHMNTYYKAKENYDKLTGDNKALITQVDLAMSSLDPSSDMKSIIDSNIDNYYSQTREQGIVGNMSTANNVKQNQGLVRALVKTEDSVERSSRAAYINVAILLYGLVNIGIILAIAFMK